MQSRTIRRSGRAALETSRFHLTVDARRGGRVVELFDSTLRRNLLLEQTPPEWFAFADGTRYPVAGWDEAIPTIEPCNGVPALGHAWRGAAACRIQEGSLDSDWALPGFSFHRRIRLDGTGMHAEYSMGAEGPSLLPVLWAAHALYPLRDLKAILLPQGLRLPGPECTKEALLRLVEDEPATGRIGIGGRPEGSWKFFTQTDGQLDLVYADARLSITTDAPWFGVWLNTGRYRPPCVGIEPTNHPTDFLSEIDASVPGLGAPRISWRLRVEAP